jgi:hypothetical protein
MPSILNQYGNVITRRDKMAMGLYPTPYSHNNFGNFRIRPWNLQDTEQSVNLSDRRNLVSFSRQLFAQMPALSACSELKAKLAVGNAYEVIYSGDPDWGVQMVRFIKRWYTRCCTAGIAFNFKKCLKILSMKLDDDGDNLALFILSKNNSPLIQFVASHRIDQRGAGNTILDGTYKGYDVANGVVKSPSGFPVGYYVRNNDPDEDAVVSTRDSYLIFDPKHFDLQRGLPVISQGITTGLSLLDIQEYLQTTIKIESMIHAVNANAAGEAPAHRTQSTSEIEEDLETSTQSPIPPQIEPVGQGIYYIKHRDRLESFKSNRPAVETANYLEDLETKLISLTGIPHQILYSPEKLGGATARGIKEIVIETILDRQQILDNFARLAVSRAIAVAIQNGELDETDEPYWELISFTHPEEFSLDRGYDNEIDLNNLRAGVDTLDNITSRRGQRSKEIRAVRKEETLELYRTIEAIKKEFPQYSENQIHNDLGMLSANPLPDNQPKPKE